MSEIFGGAKGTRPKRRYAARSEAVVVPRMLSWRESGRVLPAMACRHGGAGGTHGVSHAKGYSRYMASGCCSTSASRERASSTRLHALGDAHKSKAPPRGAVYPKAMPKPRRSEILDTVHRSMVHTPMTQTRLVHVVRDLETAASMSAGAEVKVGLLTDAIRQKLAALEMLSLL